MFPTLGRYVQNKRIKNRGGFLSSSMQQLPWGDLILLEKAFLIFPDGSRKHELYLPGVIFRRNRALEKRTHEVSTHLIYCDAYEAERGAAHSVRNYGLLSKNRATEAGDLKIDIATLREYVLFMLRMGPHFEHVLKDLYITMSDLTERYGCKVDERKKRATVHMVRGLIEKDSLGRKNIPAAALSIGGAIWNLLEREENIQWLSMRMDQRAMQTERLISAHIELYQELWDLVGKDASAQFLINASVDETILTRAKIEDIRCKIETVILRPFVKNAKHTSRDIDNVSDLLGIRGRNNSVRQQKVQGLTRLKEGIRWVFVLDALERGILFPLSYLVDELLHQERLARRRTKAKGRVVIKASLAPEKFEDLSRRLNGFRAKLAKCQDQVLAHPVKDEVIAILDIATKHIAEDDWRLVKKDLDAIVEIL